MKRFKLEPLLVALACLGPIVAAYLLYYYGDPSALPRMANEERTLLEPAVPLPPLDSGADREDGEAAGWGPRWSLIYVRTAPCDTTCVEDLARIAAVHIRLGRDQPRMRRIYIGPEPEPLAALDPMLAALPIGTPSYQAFADALVSAGVPPAEGGRLYVVDPHGNLVLSYPPRPDQEGLLKDLERLLDASRIG
ncbi:MAG: hypothetical protein WBE98_14160 [Gammaproteobacteria bacterium]